MNGRLDDANEIEPRAASDEAPPSCPEVLFLRERRGRHQRVGELELSVVAFQT